MISGTQPVGFGVSFGHSRVRSRRLPHPFVIFPRGRKMLRVDAAALVRKISG